jgi:hypothetical protein
MVSNQASAEVPPTDGLLAGRKSGGNSKVIDHLAGHPQKTSGLIVGLKNMAI